MRKVLLLALGSFALGTDAFIVAGLIPEIASETGVSEGLVGQMATVFTLFYAVSGPVLSAVLRWDTKRLLLTALVVFTLGNIGSAVSHTLVTLLVSRAVCGIGAGLYTPTAAATAAALAPPERRGRALSLLLAGLSIGTVIGVPVGLLIATHTGWRSAFWLISALGLLAAVGVALVIPRLHPSASPGIRARLAVMIDRRVAPIVVVSVLFNIASLGLYTYIAPVLRASAGVTHPIPFLWVWGIGGIVGAFAVGTLIDRSSSTRVMPVVVGLLILATAAIVPAGTALIAVAIAVGCWGAAGFASPPPQQHLLLQRAADHGTVAVAANSSAIYLGGAIGSGLAGGALHLGLTAAALPFIASAFAAAAMVVYLALVVPDRTSTPGRH